MILGIESSCDESALALFDRRSGLAGEWVFSQIAQHKAYGGVVPDLASRQHLANFPLLLEELEPILGDRPLTSVAVTCGPGLAGCLALGIALAKSLAMAWSVPLAGVNHLRGHAFSPFIKLHQKNPDGFAEALQKSLPHIGLIVSGGNTLLFEIDRKRDFRIIAQTVDDAAGEAFDKGAKLLGLGYPGGPIIEKTASKGSPNGIDFPRAFHGSAEMKFSFSGLKTSLRYRLEKMSDQQLAAQLPDICAGYQQAIIDALLRKTRQALLKGNYKSIGLSGGVANNGRLRKAFDFLAQEEELELFCAQPQHTSDNAAMIAFAAFADPAGIIAAAGLQLSFHPAMPLAETG